MNMTLGSWGEELQFQGSVQRGTGAGVLYRNPSLRTDIMTDTHTTENITFATELADGKITRYMFDRRNISIHI